MAIWMFTSTLKKLRWPWYLSPFLQNGWVYLANFFLDISRTLMLIGIKIKTKVTELGHSDCLKFYVNPSKIYVNPGI